MRPLTHTLHSGGFIDYLLDRPDVTKVWHEFTHHSFVEQLGDGTLPIERFKFYMTQDYLYLVSPNLPIISVPFLTQAAPICPSKRTRRLQSQDP